MVNKMNKYLKAHEEYMRNAIREGNADLLKLQDYHKTQIAFLQHERLVHLLVTLAVALFMVLTAGMALYSADWAFLPVALILMVLLLFYIVHYYQLENGVQRWYALYNEIVELSRERGG